MDKQSLLVLARQVLQTEADAIQAAAGRLDGQFIQAVNLMLACTGRVIVSGLGKSGLVGRKIAATLSSLGTPCSFLHPADALHGDLGMIRPQDLVLFLSYSGQTDELLCMLRFLEGQGNSSIIITGNVNSFLASRCTLALDGFVQQEACLHNMAPTASAAVALAIGDALAIARAKHCEFQVEDFARFHPGGSLGRQMLLNVADVMRTHQLPCCAVDTPLFELISLMTAGRLGAAFVIENQRLVGIITDGDLRRCLEKKTALSEPASVAMSANPITITSYRSLKEASDLMIKNQIKILGVVDDKNRLLGSIDLYQIA